LAWANQNKACSNTTIEYLQATLRIEKLRYYLCFIAAQNWAK
jgi:hypothetical protein